MLKVALHGRLLKKDDLPFLNILIETLIEEKIELQITPELQIQLNSNYPFYSIESINKPNYFITVGGDGTLLEALTMIKDSEIPVLGINFGRLGFLANVNKQAIKFSIKQLIEKKYVLEKRTLVMVSAEKEHFHEINFALNEFALLKRESSSMIHVEAWINGEILNSYWADGLIIATPTGSTGYSMSCGGPIIHPESKSFVITAVAPHNLTVRPVIIPDTCEIKIRLPENKQKAIATLDHRNINVNSNQCFIIKKAPFYFNLIRLENDTFLNTLRQKLHWGIDKRN